jgi:hypothetical protein
MIKTELLINKPECAPQLVKRATAELAKCYKLVLV